MICPKCYGVGRIAFGEEPEIFSEEEWLRQATTEQLVEAILQQWIHGAYHGVGEFGLTDKEIESARDDIVEWLKQPHTKE